jgi:flagellar biosynthesis/type III secretory pathway M-ring protein FliF/YscJ
MDTVSQILNAIFNIATMSTAGAIIRIVLLVFGGIAFFFIKKWINKKLAEAAHKKTEENRNREQAGVEPENRDLGDAAKKSEDDIEKIIKDREGKKE